MFKAQPLRKQGTYYEIKDGKFRLPSTADNPDAVRRDFMNPKTNQAGVAYELGFELLESVITDVRFVENALQDGTILRRLHLVLEENDGKPQVVSMPIDSRFAEDTMRKLPSIDFTLPVHLRPYDFKDKKGTRVIGMGIDQPNDKGEFIIPVRDFFTKVEEKDGKKTYTEMNGLPPATEEDRDDWKFYFQKINKFLIKYTKENIVPKFSDDERKNAALDTVLDDVLGGATPTAPVEYPTNEINPDDIPF